MTTKTGVYLHFKGDLFIVQNVVVDTTFAVEIDDYKRMVLYYAAKTGPVEGAMFVREENDFHLDVKWPDGKVRPRFVLIDTDEVKIGFLKSKELA